MHSFKDFLRAKKEFFHLLLLRGVTRVVLAYLLLESLAAPLGALWDYLVMLFPEGGWTLTTGSDALVEEVGVERVLDSFLVVQVVHVYHFFPQGQESVIISLIFEDLRLKLLLSFLEGVQPMCSGPS